MDGNLTVEEGGYYGLISFHTDATAVAIYDDEEIEERADTPQLELPPTSEFADDDDILKEKVGIIHQFFEQVGETAIDLFTPVKDDLDGIVILGSSPLKYHFEEGGYLGELNDIASVKNAGPVADHPLEPHVDDDKTIAEQLNSQS